MEVKSISNEYLYGDCLLCILASFRVPIGEAGYFQGDCLSKCLIPL